MATVGDPPDCGFEQYTADVYAWAYRLLGRHHDALDVVQEVFLRWDAQCARQRPGQPRGWLRRVTLNRAIDFKRQGRLQGGDAIEPRAPAVPSEPAIEPDRTDLRRDITAALDRLTEVQRNVLVAKVYDEMTFAGIAAELDLAVSTAKTHYLRAVRAMRDGLRRRWAEETYV